MASNGRSLSSSLLVLTRVPISSHCYLGSPPWGESLTQHRCSSPRPCHTSQGCSEGIPEVQRQHVTCPRSHSESGTEMSDRFANGRDAQPSPVGWEWGSKVSRVVSLEVWSVREGGKQMDMREGSG